MRLNIFNKKRYIKESEITNQKKKRLQTTPSREAFIKGLNDFMRNPPLEDYKVQNKGKNIDGIEIDYSQYISFIKKVWGVASTVVGVNVNNKNEGVSVRINSFGQNVVTFKIFIYKKNSPNPDENLLKQSRKSGLEKTTEFIENVNGEKVQVNFLDTGYGKSDIPNFYIQKDNNNIILYAKRNGKLLKATEAAESLVADYFNKISGVEDLTKNLTNKMPEAINVIRSDSEWNQSCENNALGIINFLEEEGFKKGDFVAVHPTWIGTREKDIVINEYLDPSDIFLVEKQNFEFNKDNLTAKEEDENIYKNRCKEEFSTSNSRPLGVSLKKLKLLIEKTVEQNESSKKVFKTPNFFLTGWKMKSSPKVIYKKNPTERDLKSKNYFVSEVSIKVSNSRDSESGESGKTMYFNCIVNGEEKLLFTIRKNGGENFVLEAAGSEGTESQGGKCSKLIDFVVKDQHFKDSLMVAIKKFNLAQEEAKKLAKGEEGNLSIVENELDNIDYVLQRINDLQGFELPEESVKRAAIAFAFAKKLPFFSEDRSVDDLVIKAFSKLGYNGGVYDKNSKTPIYLGFGKDAYYSGN